MNEELKPCPFCGGTVELEIISGYGVEFGTDLRRDWWGIQCKNTINLGGSCALQIRPSATKEAAIGRWNTRAAQQPAAPADRAAAVERAAALAEKVSGIETANTIRHGGVIMRTDNPCPHCARY